MLNLSIFERFELSGPAALEALVLNRAATAVELLTLVTLKDLCWDETALLASQTIGHGLEQFVVLHFIFIDIVN